jgi:hypothetical protein
MDKLRVDGNYKRDCFIPKHRGILQLTDQLKMAAVPKHLWLETARV